MLEEWSHDVILCPERIVPEKRGQRVDGNAESVVGRVCSSTASDR